MSLISLLVYVCGLVWCASAQIESCEEAINKLQQLQNTTQDSCANAPAIADQVYNIEQELIVSSATKINGVFVALGQLKLSTFYQNITEHVHIELCLLYIALNAKYIRDWKVPKQEQNLGDECLAPLVQVKAKMNDTLYSELTRLKREPINRYVFGGLGAALEDVMNGTQTGVKTGFEKGFETGFANFDQVSQQYGHIPGIISGVTTGVLTGMWSALLTGLPIGLNAIPDGLGPGLNALRGFINQIFGPGSVFNHNITQYST